MIVVVAKFSRVRVTGPRSLSVDEMEAAERLMLGASFVSSEKVSELDFDRRFARRQVGFV
jgi:hypothetical protein